VDSGRHEQQTGQGRTGRATGLGGGQLLQRELLAGGGPARRVPGAVGQQTVAVLRAGHARIGRRRGRDRVLFQRQRGPHQGVRPRRRIPAAGRHVHQLGHVPLAGRRAPARGRVRAHPQRFRIARRQRGRPVAVGVDRGQVQGAPAEGQRRRDDARLSAIRRRRRLPDAGAGRRVETRALSRQDAGPDQLTRASGAGRWRGTD